MNTESLRRGTAIARWAAVDGLPLAFFVALAMFMAWRLGQDVSWDLRQYHFYTPHLLFDGRFARDIEPAGVQTYFNPILDIPFYVGVKVLRSTPIVIGLAHAAFHGLSLWLVYRLVKLLAPADDSRLTLVAASVAAVTGALGAAFSGQLGGTAGDNTVSVLVLTALILFLAGIGAGETRQRRSVRLSALLIGFAAGAKLVAAMYAVGLLAAVIVTGSGLRNRVARTVSFGVYAAMGMLVSCGYWLWLMYQHFGSPLFPFFDASLQSPYATVTRYLGDRFRPRTLAQAVFYPFFFVTDQALVNETPFHDARFAVAFVAVVAFAVVAASRRWRCGTAWTGVGDVRILAFMVFVTTSYVVWERYSSIYRFAVTLEITAAVVLIASAMSCLRSRVATLTLVLPVCLLLVASTKPVALARVPWAPTYFGVDPAALSEYRAATILMWDMPNAYVVPLFPSSTAFIRIRSNWSHAREPAMRDRVQRRIANADRQRLYFLDLPQEEEAAKAQDLEALGLALDPTRCRPFSSLFEAGRLCPVVDLRVPWEGAAVGRTVPATYEGYHDITDCHEIMGWAWDQARPDATLDIDVYVGTRLLARVNANQFRQDLLQARKGNGKHGFTIPTPADLRDGTPHDIYMKFAGTTANLHNGPRHITCAPPAPRRD
jgi:hypothetical protein